VETVVVPFDGGAIMSMRDITSELKAESEQSEFISTASHEMRTPVASIRGFIELSLNQQTALIDERARGYLEKALAASEHLGKLFQDLLDSTKLDDGHIKTHLQPVNMAGLARQIADEMAPNVAAKGLTYQFGEETNEKKLEQPLYARVDAEFVTEILNNLIENAIKYTKQGSVTVTTRGDEQFVYVAVTDTGMGVAPADAEHIFQKFYRVDNSDTRTIGGTGLGLYIAGKRAEALGGTIKLRSTVGQGSTFTLVVPRLTQEQYDKLRLVEQNNAWVAQGKVVE
jgi:signal transduction histidine kinase